MAQGK